MIWENRCIFPFNRIHKRPMIKGIILDLDGTVYLGKQVVPDAPGFISRFQQAGGRCLFATNRANRTPERIRDQLNSYGIACTADDVLTSSQATVQYLKHGSVFFIGEEGLQRELENAGMKITDTSPDYVIVSFDRTVTYEKIKKACRLIDAGAKFIATNPDKALRTEEGIVPGTGAIVAAITTGCGREPLVIGKPERLIMDMSLERLGMTCDEVIVIGDGIATDIPAGKKAGMRTVLLLTGVTRREEISASPDQPTWVAEDYKEMTNLFFNPKTGLMLT